MADKNRKLKVFLCHASENQPVVKALHDRLLMAGYEPWMDSEVLVAGMNPGEETAKALRSSDAVIVCLSKTSVTKPGNLQKQLKLAQEIQDEQPEGSIFLIPLLLDNCEIPFALRNIHWAEYNKPNGFEQLLRSLNHRARQLKKDIGKLPEPGAAPVPHPVVSHPGDTPPAGGTHPSVDGLSVFISYAWGDKPDDEWEVIVNQIDEALQRRGLKIIRDKRDLRYKGSIREFMEQLGRGDCIIAVISDKYLRSPSCMFELMTVAENKDFHERIFPIVLKNADIYKGINRIRYIKYWDEKIAELNAEIKTVDVIANMNSILDEINLYKQIRTTIDSLINVLKDMNTLTPEMHRDSDFSQLYEALEKRRTKDPS